jgi:hypothetical protein
LYKEWASSEALDFAAKALRELWVRLEAAPLGKLLEGELG